MRVCAVTPSKKQGLQGLQNSTACIGEIVVKLGSIPIDTCARSYQIHSVMVLVLVLLLCGSDKADQDRAIGQAIQYLDDWKQRGRI